MAVAVLVLGRQNSPNYVACSDEVDLDSNFHYKLHTSLDFVDEKLAFAGKGSAEIRELYLGLLHGAEDYKYYGYVTNTKVKFIIVFESAAILRDNDIRAMFRKLHTAYVDVISNPFYIPGSVISSRTFKDITRGLLRKTSKP